MSAGRFRVYDAQNFVVNPDGSKRLQVLWDSENWGPDHAFTHPTFNRPIVWNRRIYRPTYDGRIDVYSLPGQATRRRALACIARPLVGGARPGEKLWQAKLVR